MAGGKLEGSGFLTYSPSDPLGRDSYRGDFRAGKRHGFGTFKWKSGAVYSGSYVGDERVGFGSFDFDNDDATKRKRYEGQWEKSVMSGHGQLVYQVNTLSYTRRSRSVAGRLKESPNVEFPDEESANEESPMVENY